MKMDGKSVNEHTYQSLLDFFVEHSFMKFMDSGRSGLASAAEDTIHNFIDFTQATVPALSKVELSQEKQKEIYNYLCRELVDGFIREGSKGLRNGIAGAHMFIVNALRETKNGK